MFNAVKLKKEFNAIDGRIGIPACPRTGKDA